MSHIQMHLGESSSDHWESGMAPITEYRSLEDLNHLIIHNMHRFPKETSLVVGIPRSGMLAATLIGLYLNVPVSDFAGFVERRGAEVGRRGARLNGNRVMIVDDSVASGAALSAARERLAREGFDSREFVWAALITHPDSGHLVDIFLEKVEMPRVFEWNVMHHREMPKWALDIDGVLCRDPTPIENDDGPRYEDFLSNVESFWRPSRPVGWLVTCRLEKYRDATEDWLRRNDIEYGELVMLDLPSSAARQVWGRHAEFKAHCYRTTGASLFVESNALEARRIAVAARASVYCVEQRDMVQPDGLAGLPVQARRRLGRLRRTLRSRTAAFSARRAL